MYLCVTFLSIIVSGGVANTFVYKSHFLDPLVFDCVKLCKIRELLSKTGLLGRRDNRFKAFALYIVEPGLIPQHSISR